MKNLLPLAVVALLLGLTGAEPSAAVGASIVLGAQ